MWNYYTNHTIGKVIYSVSAGTDYLFFFMLLEFTIGQICPYYVIYNIKFYKNNAPFKNFCAIDNFYLFMKSFS